jgi:hypothetical protein
MEAGRNRLSVTIDTIFRPARNGPDKWSLQKGVVAAIDAAPKWRLKMTAINAKKSRLQLVLLAAAALGSSSAVLSGAVTVLAMQQPAHVSTLA